MALQIVGQARKKPQVRPEDPFSMYVVDCEGPPMVHVTRNRALRVVIFGKNQKMLTPVVLGSGGPMLLNASDGDEKVQISKITDQDPRCARDPRHLRPRPGRDRPRDGQPRASPTPMWSPSSPRGLDPEEPPRAFCVFDALPAAEQGLRSWPSSPAPPPLPPRRMTP